MLRFFKGAIPIFLIGLVGLIIGTVLPVAWRYLVFLLINEWMSLEAASLVIPAILGFLFMMLVACMYFSLKSDCNY